MEYDLEGPDIDVQLKDNDKIILSVYGLSDFDVDLLRVMSHEDQCSYVGDMLHVMLVATSEIKEGRELSAILSATVKAVREDHDIFAIKAEAVRVMSTDGQSRGLDARATLFPSNEFDLPAIWHTLAEQVSRDLGDRPSVELH